MGELPDQPFMRAAANVSREPFFYHPNPKLSLCLELPLSLQNQAKLQILKAALCCFSKFKS